MKSRPRFLVPAPLSAPSTVDEARQLPARRLSLVWRRFWGEAVTLSIAIGLMASARALAADSETLVGHWQFKNPDLTVQAEFKQDGTFRQTTTSAEGQSVYSGRYERNGLKLMLVPQGAEEALEFTCRFLDADTLLLVDTAGVGVQMKRLASSSSAGASDTARATGIAAPANADPGIAPRPGPSPTREPTSGPTAAPAAARKPLRMMLRRTWEPNERAFTFLMPEGWQFAGGVFNVNPLQMNGPGNTLAPKCDLVVKKDERGTVMFRWAPVWYYADLTYSPTGSSFFSPGSYYRGMQVKPVISAKEYLLELFRTARPQAAEVNILTADPLREVVEACGQANASMNQQIQQMGLRPTTYDACALLVEYTEAGLRFREVLTTVLVDARGSAFSWNNVHTTHLRAPAAEFESWKPVLDTIRLSDKMNPEWQAAVRRAVADRTQIDRATQNHVNRTLNEILDHRRKTHAEMRYENWLFITGQNEFRNPFTGETEVDTDYWRYRWQDNQGDLLYTDENSLDPNELEPYKTREWKRTPVRER